MKRFLAALTLTAALAGAWAFPGLFPGSVGSTATAHSSGLFSPASYATIAGAMTRTGDYISQPSQNTDPATTGTGIFAFNVPTAGNYYLTGIFDCIGPDANSFFAHNTTLTTDHVWHAPTSADGAVSHFVTHGAVTTTPKIWNLATGVQSFTVGGREAAAKLYSLTLRALGTPAITSSTDAVGTDGSSFSYTITGSHYPTSFTSTSLPTGLTLTGTSGVITGTLASGSGSFTPTIRAINATGTGSTVLTMAIAASGTSSGATLVADSASYTHVAAKVALAVDGDTVSVPAGTATWTSTLNLSNKAIRLIASGTASTIITNAAPGNNLIRSNATGTNLVRISGFRFNSSFANSTFVIHFAGPSYKVRVDNCYFDNGDCAVGRNSWLVAMGAGPVWGVVDNCHFRNVARIHLCMDGRIGDTALGSPDGTIPGSDYDGATSWTEAIEPGTEKMMYFEDNTCVWDGGEHYSAHGILYGTGGGKVCLRYNTLSGNDLAVDAHGDYPGHSTQYYEIYRNIFTYGPRLLQGESFFLRGGQHIVHNNTFTYPYTRTINLTIYHGNDNPAHWITNSYFWSNTANGSSTQSDIVGTKESAYATPTFSADNIILNSDYFLRAPESGDVYFPYSEYTYPHPVRALP